MSLQGINVREMLAGASLMDEANRTTVVSLWLSIVVFKHCLLRCKEAC